MTSHPPVPAVIRRVWSAIAVVAAVHVVALFLILLHRDVIFAAISARSPGPDIEKLTDNAVYQGVVPHVILAVLLPLRAWRLRAGRPSARTWLTVILAIQLLAHATLPMVLAELPGYGPWVIAVQAFSFVFEVTALWLLWSPAARSFFTPPNGPARRSAPDSSPRRSRP